MRDMVEALISGQRDARPAEPARGMRKTMRAKSAGPSTALDRRFDDHHAEPAR
ncbi:MAG: hypothetical protein PHQ28_03750 [Mycobacterium sp.]|nr:hypothetical protein [Mycobacterium sp.]